MILVSLSPEMPLNYSGGRFSIIFVLSLPINSKKSVAMAISYNQYLQMQYTWENACR